MIEYHDFRLYNVDQLPEQQYFFDHDIFPLGFFRINNNTSGLDWKTKGETVWSTDYYMPYFEKIHIKLSFPKGKIVKLTDKLNSISIIHYNDDNNSNNKDKSQIIDITGSTEKGKLQELLKLVQDIDPDFIFTDDGDSFTFPYLIYRARINEINLCLGSDNNIPLKFLIQCQNEILEILAQGNSISDIKQNKLPLIIKKIENYNAIIFSQFV